MKKIVNLMLFLIAFSFCNSCSKEDDSNDDTPDAGDERLFNNNLPTGVDFMDYNSFFQLNEETCLFLSDWVLAYDAATAGDKCKESDFSSAWAKKCLIEGYKPSLNMYYDFEESYYSFKITGRDKLEVSTIYASTDKPSNPLMLSIAGIYDSGTSTAAQRFGHNGIKNLYFGKKDTRTLNVKYEFGDNGEDGYYSIRVKNGSGDKIGTIEYLSRSKEWIVDISNRWFRP